MKSLVVDLFHVVDHEDDDAAGVEDENGDDVGRPPSAAAAHGSEWSHFYSNMPSFMSVVLNLFWFYQCFCQTFKDYIMFCVPYNRYLL